jgi:hypothetical protein
MFCSLNLNFYLPPFTDFVFVALIFAIILHFQLLFFTFLREPLASRTSPSLGIRIYAAAEECGSWNFFFEF